MQFANGIKTEVVGTIVLIFFHWILADDHNSLEAICSDLETSYWSESTNSCFAKREKPETKPIWNFWNGQQECQDLARKLGDNVWGRLGQIKDENVWKTVSSWGDMWFGMRTHNRNSTNLTEDWM